METPLRKVRVKKSLKLKDVAAATGIDQGQLSRIEHGKQQASPDLAAKLARYYKNAVTEMQVIYPERYITSSAGEEKA